MKGDCRNESSAREGIDTRHSRIIQLSIYLVEMSHQPERALTPLTSNDISYGKMRRNESSAREGIDTTAPVEGVVHWP